MAVPNGRDGKPPIDWLVDHLVDYYNVRVPPRTTEVWKQEIRETLAMDLSHARSIASTIKGMDAFPKNLPGMVKSIFLSMKKGAEKAFDPASIILSYIKDHLDFLDADARRNKTTLYIQAEYELRDALYKRGIIKQSRYEYLCGLNLQVNLTGNIDRSRMSEEAKAIARQFVGSFGRITGKESRF